MTMDQNCARARAFLEQEGYTCVLARGEAVCTSRERGVGPLLQWLASGADFQGFSAADKVVGRAAAFLYVLLGVPAIYAGVISRPALAVLEEHGIRVSYTSLVPAIRNRTDTGFCPMESAVLQISDPAQALVVIQNKVQELRRAGNPVQHS